MKKVIAISSILIFCFGTSICQTNKLQKNTAQIKKTIVNFLKWYKKDQKDTSKKTYSTLRGGYPDTTTKPYIDTGGLEMYLNHFRQTGYVTESYLDALRNYFKEIGEGLKAAPKTKDLVKINGMDIDFVLGTFEPEMILDHIKEGRFDKICIIYNKAIVRFRISKVIKVLFTLTRIKNNWMIDYIGYDNTYDYSIGKQ